MAFLTPLLSPAASATPASYDLTDNQCVGAVIPMGMFCSRPAQLHLFPFIALQATRKRCFRRLHPFVHQENRSKCVSYNHRVVLRKHFRRCHLQQQQLLQQLRMLSDSRQRHCSNRRWKGEYMRSPPHRSPTLLGQQC